MIKAIVAAGKNWEIGKNNGLLFSLKEDMKLFKKVTANKIVVCGENTLLSFPGQKPLKNRSTIVLCSENHEYENCICIHDFNKLVDMLKVLAITNDIYVIGGGMLYNSMLPYYDEVLVNKVNAEDKAATVYFPNLDASGEFLINAIYPEVIDNNYKTRLYKYKKIRGN